MPPATLRLSPIVLLLVGGWAGCTGSPGSPSSAEGEDLPQAAGVGSGSVEGVVVDARFVPIPGALIRVLETRDQASSDPEGRFWFHALAPKTYHFRVSHVAWRPQDVAADVDPGRTTRLTVFLEPVSVPEPYHSLREIRGTLSCVEASLAGQNLGSELCPQVRRPLELPRDWAATMTEVSWGKSGFSSSAQGSVWLGHGQDPPVTYARVVSDSPTRIALLPGRTHAETGGTDATPAKGVPGPLELELRKASTRLVGNELAAGLTLQESFEVYHTTFFHEAPEDLEAYSAVPEN